MKVGLKKIIWYFNSDYFFFYFDLLIKLTNMCFIFMERFISFLIKLAESY